MHFTFIDIVFFIVLLVFGIMACAKGFIKELFGKLSVFAGLFAAVFFCGRLSPYLEKIIRSKAVCAVVSFILLFITVFLLVKIIQTIISGAFKGEILKSLDRVLGFAFGVLEGLVIVCLFLVLIEAQPWFDPAPVAGDSFFWRLLSGVLERPVQTLGGIFV